MKLNKKYYIRNIIIAGLLIITAGCGWYQINHIDLKNATEPSWKKIRRIIRIKGNAAEKDTKARFFYVGNVIDIQGNTIICGLKNRNKPILMGETLYVVVNNRTIKVRAVFPMQTVVKCTISGRDSGQIGNIRKGALVIKYHK